MLSHGIQLAAVPAINIIKNVAKEEEEVIDLPRYVLVRNYKNVIIVDVTKKKATEIAEV